MTSGLNRRQALTGAAIAAAATPILAACGGNDSSSAQDPAGSGSSKTPSGGGNSSGTTATALAQTSDIPVGGGEVLANDNVVITQPTKGTFKGFSATCTHQGCTLASVSDGTINCGCHGSQFSIKDGSNVTGPSGSPAGSVAALPEVAIKVEGSSIVKG